MELSPEERLILELIEAGAVMVRDVQKGEKPFEYASGGFGPGYVSIKQLVGRRSLMEMLARKLAALIASRVHCFDCVAGNATGGIIPGFLVAGHLENLLERSIPFVYILKEQPKWQKEMVVGFRAIPDASPRHVLIVDDVVNFASTICRSAGLLREMGHSVSHAACILSYNNPEGLRALSEASIELIYRLELDQVLDVAERHGCFSPESIGGFKSFLEDPALWQRTHM